MTDGAPGRPGAARLEAARPLGRGAALLGGGARALAVRAAGWWRTTGGRQRLAAAATSAGVLVAVALLPWLAVLCGVLASGCALLAGFRTERAEAQRCEAAARRAEDDRLWTVRAALEPFFGPVTAAEAPSDGERTETGVTESAFAEGRLVRLGLRYPPRFPDTDPDARSAVEGVLAAKLGRDREMRAEWDTERNLLTVDMPDALPQGLAARRFTAAPGELVLGFTDTDSVARTMPVAEGADGEALRDAAPVVWRTGARCAAANLLAAGPPGAGMTSLLRSLALQGLAAGGEVVLVDGAGAGGFGAFAGRPGVLSVETTPRGAAGVLDWVARETQRRLLGVDDATRWPDPGGLARRRYPPAPPRPLWVIVDGVVALAHRARLASAADPQELLEVPSRHGRACGVTVVAAEQLASLPGLAPAVWTTAGARVVLGAVTAECAAWVLGAPLGGSPAAVVPPGRGYARIGEGAVRRLQVPATPDPADETAAAWQRSAVAALLPAVPGPADFPAESLPGG